MNEIKKINVGKYILASIQMIQKFTDNCVTDEQKINTIQEIASDFLQACNIVIEKMED